MTNFRLDNSITQMLLHVQTFINGCDDWDKKINKIQMPHFTHGDVLLVSISNSYWASGGLHHGQVTSITGQHRDEHTFTQTLINSSNLE